MAKIYFVSLGCDKNRVDAEIMAAKLIDAGHVISDDLEDADCAIVNTCGFITEAKEQAVENIFDMIRAKEAGLLRAVVVTGCLAQRYKESVSELIPEIDGVIGLAGNEDIVSVVEKVLSGEKLQVFSEPEALRISGERVVSTPQHFAYLKIAEGCSNHCTYCAIPSIRGIYRSRPESEIIAEAKTLVAVGAQEIILIAQDTTSYGKDLEGGESLARLLSKLCEIDGIWKIRILYAYPEKITDELINVMSAQDKIAKYIDIPMQHANAEVLRRMGRGGSGEELKSLLARLRNAMPDITIRSTFIVGFPGETEEQFLELCDFLRETRLDRAGCFPFSAEEGTPAEKLPEQLPDEVKKTRAEQFSLLQSGIMQDITSGKVGSEFDVICDGFDEDMGMFACRGESDAPEVDGCVWLPLECDLIPGEVYRVRAVSAEDVDLIAEIVED